LKTRYLNMLAFVALAAIIGSAMAVCPTVRTTDMDMCGRRLFLIGDRSKDGLPTTLEGMETHCSQLQLSQRCIANYTSECLEAMPKQVTGLLLKGAGVEVVKQCADAEKRAEFILHTPCYNADWNNMHTCMENYIDKLQGVGNAKKDDKIPLTCCNYYKFHNCIINNLVAKGDAVCTLADRNYMSAMLNGFAAEVLGLLCGHTPPNSDLCNVLISPDKAAGLERTLSMLPPFINAFSNF